MISVSLFHTNISKLRVCFASENFFRKGIVFKLNMKDAYFSVPLHQSSRKYLRFLWARNEFLCLCFGLGPSPRIFTKLNVPMSMLRRINIRIIIHLGDMLLMGATVEEISMSRDTLSSFCNSGIHSEFGNVHFELCSRK